MTTFGPAASTERTLAEIAAGQSSVPFDGVRAERVLAEIVERARPHEVRLRTARGTVCARRRRAGARGGAAGDIEVAGSDVAWSSRRALIFTFSVTVTVFGW